MDFASELLPATLVRRYSRFLADVVLANGETITVHVANPGAMTGLQSSGARVWLSKSANPARKLAYSWELVEADLGTGLELVGVNTMHPNAIVAQALAQNGIAQLSGYTTVRREVKYGRTRNGKSSRIDFLLEAAGRAPCYVEVKNVHLMRVPGLAEFPDSVTSRGAKHLDELAHMATTGCRAVMLFVIQVGSAKIFSLARDIDPDYAKAFDRAQQAGVEALAHVCEITGTGITLGRAIPIETSV